MCGIAGQLKWNEPVNLAELSAMRDSLSHRGPDSFGSTILNENTVGLAHRRLSILDLSSAGAQPMSDEAGKIWIVFNGMISNFRALKDELLANGVHFKSSSDTEVLIYAYKHWGRAFLNKLKGMFSFALWDQENQTLLLARDQFGIKPLYFTVQEGGFYFASEQRAFRNLPHIKRTLSLPALRDFLFYRYVPGPDTAWKEINTLMPGEWLELTLPAKNQPPCIKKGRYWAPEFHRERTDPARLKTQISDLISQSVHNNTISDVPLGLFLSGGIDSATLGYFAKEHVNALHSFTIGFDGWPKSEHQAAQEAADYLGLVHSQRIVDVNSDLFFSELAKTYDDPFGGTSFWPTKNLCAFARDTVTVAMGGDGADEIFSGYNWYPKEDFDGETTQAFSAYLTAMDWGMMSGDEIAALLGLPRAETIPYGHMLQDKVDWKHGGIKALQKLDMETFLPDVVLTKIDRAAMAHGLELRVPYLDTDLADLVFSLHPDALLDQTQHKPLLSSLLPSEFNTMLQQRPKQGFGAPVAQYITFEVLCKTLENSNAVREGFLNRKVINSLIETKRYRSVFAITALASWYDQWI